MLRLLIHFAAGMALLFIISTEELAWNPCQISAGLLACWDRNPIMLPLLILYTIGTIIFVIGQLNEKRS